MNNVPTVKHGGGFAIFWTALLYLVQGALSLGRAQGDLKTINKFWIETYCPVSESSVLVASYGSPTKIPTQNIQL